MAVRPTLLIADKEHRIFDVPGIEAVGMKACGFFRIRGDELVRLPRDSELFVLPARMAVGYDAAAKAYVDIDRNPFSKHYEACYPVAAFLAPGFTAACCAAYKEKGRPKLLPLFSYAYAAFYKGEFYTSCVRIDREKRQELALMDQGAIRRNILRLRKTFPRNRLMRHLETCALVYGCPAGKNFFLSRYEAPLPVSPSCNSGCIGCISYQPYGKCPVTQPRIEFIPTPEEIKEVALLHIMSAKDPVVSFGQGCEGEPLLAGSAIERAIKLIRRETSKGTINLNTNASKPEIIERLFDAGLDSMRVSMNSAREKYYAKYYRPRGYAFRDVLDSIKRAKKRNGFVSINYLVMPGFTDSTSEFEALSGFIGKYKVDMIQWRNLNFDPLGYFRELGIKGSRQKLMGVGHMIRMVRKLFPGLLSGYFNPSRQRIKRNLTR